MDPITGLWCGTGAEATVNAMATAGSQFYTADEIAIFQAGMNAITAIEEDVDTAQDAVDTQASTTGTALDAYVNAYAELAGDPEDSELILGVSASLDTLTTARGTLATLMENLVGAEDTLAAAEVVYRTSYNGKPNPFI